MQTIKLKAGQEHLSIPIQRIGEKLNLVFGIMEGRVVPQGNRMEFVAVGSVEKELKDREWMTILMDKELAKILKKSLNEIEL